ncbi:hypothetical protein [Xanthomonas sp. XNM01]|uniref:hypothetical protein n=1 Tax=Xanthomonas sp. XNM01 TaxID=2769289 RepID=UPI00177E0616|nr:hypothetical protein [Xanthomonas sp. XNM01]MBD9369975.1 hypothetical protein [Xanthomonas sp. XNM01]
MRPFPVRPLSFALVLLLAACADPAPPASPAASTIPAADALPAAPADPASEVRASMGRFLAARSFEATMRMEGARAIEQRLEFVAPDRYRIVLPAGTQVVVGDTLYLSAGGHTRQVPLEPGVLAEWRDPMRLGSLGDALQVEDRGADLVDGRPARRYRVQHGDPQPLAFDYWVDARGLPLQIVTRGTGPQGDYAMTLRYARFDDPAIRIDPP